MMVQTKTVLNSDTIPLVDIDFMNNTHFEEIEMVKDLGKLISAYQQKDSHTNEEIKQISEGLNAWLDHTKFHFERENQLMQDSEFPAYPIHFEEHKIALEKMTTVINIWNKNRDIDLIADYVFILWPSWFIVHVNSMDMVTAQFAIMNGFSEK